MRPVLGSVIAFASVFGGAMLGVLLRAVVPSSHVGPESKETVRLTIGLVATMAALVLGLLVASAKATYDTNNAELTQMSSQVILLDRLLANYGPDAQPARDVLRTKLIQQVHDLWPNEAISLPADANLVNGEDLYLIVQRLSPKDDRQKLIRSDALTATISIGQLRWLFFVQGSNSVPIPLLVIMISWLTVVFISFGMFAPLNWTTIGSLLVAALSVSAAILLILEMYSPFGGVIHIPSTSVRSALAQLGR